jgi:hypothetical protein
MSYDLLRVGEIIQQAKQLAKNYHSLTGRPLGVTGEIAEYEAARLLGLQLSEVRQPGYDATFEKDGEVVRLQIKGRCILNNSKSGQRLGSIRLNHEWDSIVLILLDSDFEPICLYMANRPEVQKALTDPGSKARNERGALSISKFKSISRLVWSAPQLAERR